MELSRQDDVRASLFAVLPLLAAEEPWDVACADGAELDLPGVGRAPAAPPEVSGSSCRCTEPSKCAPDSMAMVL